jgi:hypothetical protein
MLAGQIIPHWQTEIYPRNSLLAFTKFFLYSELQQLIHSMAVALIMRHLFLDGR